MENKVNKNKDGYASSQSNRKGSEEEDGYAARTRDGYTRIDKEELDLIRQLGRNIEHAQMNVKIADATLAQAQAEQRAAQAEFRAAEAEYQSTTLRIYWKYKLDNEDTISQVDGSIIKG